MLPLIVLILSTLVMDCLAKPTTESTHMILQRLGFDQIRKPVVNHHRKRLAQETSKARHHIEGYNIETDSHMFVVKLPPHSPYYSHLTPEKFENEVLSKSSMNFRTNGKPAGVYHWNIPVLKRLPQIHSGEKRSSQTDSKVYHVKILPEEYQKDYKEKEKPYKKLNKLKRQRYETRPNRTKQGGYQKNAIRLHNSVKSGNPRKDQNFSVKFTEAEKSDSRHHHPANYIPKMKNKNHTRDNVNDNLLKDSGNAKGKRQTGLSYYQPALPKQNSFHKDFTSNGKPKSFYVIEKSNKATRYHRLQ